MRDLLAHGPHLTWVRQTIKEGSKGPLVAEFAFLRVTPVRDMLPASRVWLILQRTLSPQPEIQFYLSNAPTTCPPREFIRVSGLRWPVETTLKEGKGQVGMAHNETRTWLAWHHHLNHVLLAQLFLMHLRLHWPERPALTTAQAHLLIAQAIAEEAWPLRNVLAILHYRQRRNYAAYRSHRKRTLKRQQQLSQSQKHKKRSSGSPKSP